ncbi:hypothetical protein K439DRAFT_1663102 [Ramaria rubella]|nr:hypothetical protein K439DRAFT_1663102 [Ramaria rubella]
MWPASRRLRLTPMLGLGLKSASGCQRRDEVFWKSKRERKPKDGTCRWHCTYRRHASPIFKLSEHLHVCIIFTQFDPHPKPQNEQRTAAPNTLQTRDTGLDLRGRETPHALLKYAAALSRTSPYASDFPPPHIASLGRKATAG